MTTLERVFEHERDAVWRALLDYTNNPVTGSARVKTTTLLEDAKLPVCVCVCVHLCLCVVCVVRLC